MPPIRVMVVDDSVVVRKIVTDVLSADPAIEVVGTAVNGRVALAKLDQLRPDLITMDIEMPEMDGIEAVARHPRQLGRRIPIIMFSTLTERGATATLDALSAGANDYVTKPANVGSVGQSMESVREQLIPRIKALTGRPAGRRSRPRPPRRRAVRAAAAPRTAAAQEARRPGHRVLHRRPGGPDQGAPAAAARLSRCRCWSSSTCRRSSPASSPQRLDRLSALRVVEAVDGTPLRPGTVHIAPGDHHLRGPPRRARPAPHRAEPGRRRRTSAGRPSTRCSAPPSPPTTAPCWPSS